MLVHGLRLLVALITFGVGVAASSLLGSRNSVRCGKRVATQAAVLVAAPSLAAPPPHGARSVDYSRRIVSRALHSGNTISKPAPVYPRAARAAGVGGTVVVRVVVREDGGVDSAEAVSGPLLLRGAAEEAAREARFTPTLLSGTPVMFTGVISYNFVLE